MEEITLDFDCVARTCGMCVCVCVWWGRVRECLYSGVETFTVCVRRDRKMNRDKWTYRSRILSQVQRCASQRCSDRDHPRQPGRSRRRRNQRPSRHRQFVQAQWEVRRRPWPLRQQARRALRRRRRCQALRLPAPGRVREKGGIEVKPRSSTVARSVINSVPSILRKGSRELTALSCVTRTWTWTWTPLGAVSCNAMPGLTPSGTWTLNVVAIEVKAAFTRRR